MRTVFQGILGISGFGAAGKSTLAGEYSRNLGVPVISVDDFFKREALPGEAWDCIDWDLIRRAILEPISAGRTSLRYERWEYGTGIRIPTELHLEGPAVILEGVGLFRPGVAEHLAEAIWLECPLEIAIARGAQRDRREYGVDHDSLWQGVWRENELNCLDRHATEIGRATRVPCWMEGIRPATVSDVPAIARFFVEVRRQTVPSIHGVEDVEGYLTAVLLPRGSSFVIEVGGSPVAWLDVHERWVEHLYCHPNFTGLGLGKRLLDFAKELSPEGLQLYTFQVNHGARRFYAREGFREVELSDGSGNEERAPDVRLCWTPDSPRRATQACLSGSRT